MDETPRTPLHRRRGAITGVFILLTAIMTWPQVTVLGTQAMDDQDVFFSLWRLRWIAHALATSPLDLFNGNVFYPERGVLAFSDAIILQGVLAAPLHWAGAPPVLVYNLMLLGAMVASGVGMFVLARHLTGSSPGGLVAGIIFAFAPYRFDHYHHLELQWTVWSPWAFWAMQRALESSSWRFGVLTGIFGALQLLSSVYYGVFLIIVLAAVSLTQILTLRGRKFARSATSLVLAAAIVVSVAALYSRPYSAASSQVGVRSAHETTRFSARPRDYTMAMPDNLLYGSGELSVAERRLFPGLLPPLLGLVGLLLVRPTPVVISYVIGLLIAFELSLGFFGTLYPFLYKNFTVLHGLRAPARASVFVLLCLAILAAHGTAALTSSMTLTRQAAAGIALCGILLLEYWTALLPLVAYPNKAPTLYKILASLPRGVVAEFPMPSTKSPPPRHDPRFAYMSTFHWMPLVNGYSGFFPASYMERLDKVARFPDVRSVEELKREGVRYVIVHSDGYVSGERGRIIERLLELGLKGVGNFEDGWSVGTIMELP